jgi:EAL domain-containing protein (putative c-di-GMP-specific phosphodiesterase class I)
LIIRSLWLVHQCWLLLERDLRRGIERGELSLVFQRQYAVTGGRPVGAEALVRWNHPERGPISPKMFIPVAEATGLIRPLGRWVLEEACRAIRRSIEAGHEIGIGVNLSAAQLRHGDFVGILQSALSDAGIRPELLEIEITESLLFEPSNDAIAEMLRQIAAMGVRLGVDDFGTGYSSLAYLKRFPVHKIKIDQSFVRDIGRDKDDDMIVAAMVSLAHSLGKRAIAEGVETNEQLAFLRKLGCDEVQGYVLARPMPEAALAELLAAG